MKPERKIRAFKHYFRDFINEIEEAAADKIFKVLDILKMNMRVSAKFVKAVGDGLFELRVEYESNIYRVFFIFDRGDVVILFNGFQKKSQKTPQKELEKAKRIKKCFMSLCLLFALKNITIYLLKVLYNPVGIVLCTVFLLKIKV